MVRLTDTQIADKVRFIHDYMRSFNAADGSKLDANANVTVKNIATLEAEMNKDVNIQVNRRLVADKIAELYGPELEREYLRQIEAHEIYIHDETSLKPYCVSVTMYPLLLDGLKKLGGESAAPKHLASFCGSFVNFVFAVSAQFAGAVATVEFLTYFDYFARKEWGDDYLSTHTKEVVAALQQVVYSINQPAAARGYQSVFWNISIYDRYYFESMFDRFFFPDGSPAQWKTVDRLQKFFLTWFNQERTKALLTFPVVTVALLTEGERARDRDYARTCARELNEGNSFFMYLSETADSLASCCRLRSEISDKTFSYTLGAGGVATGSINVITLNMNRLVQDRRSLEDEVRKIQKYQIAYRRLMEDFQKSKMLSVYDAGFISMDKQFLTLGINGLVEAAEFLGYEIGDNAEYKSFCGGVLKKIYALNRAAAAESGYKFNTELVPAENLGVKNALWDKKEGYAARRDCYNSYFYLVEDEDIPFTDKFVLHGREILQYLDGGSALHLNLDESLTTANFERLIDLAAATGCNYFCTNVRMTVCNECAHLDKQSRFRCAKCGSEDVDHATRIIGYLKRVSAFSAGRRAEHASRHYHLESARPRVSPSPTNHEGISAAASG